MNLSQPVPTTPHHEPLRVLKIRREPSRKVEAIPGCTVSAALPSLTTQKPVLPETVTPTLASTSASFSPLTWAGSPLELRGRAVVLPGDV